LHSATSATVVGTEPFGHFGPPIAYGGGMKRISSNIVGISIFALALSTVVVGFGWAGSSALRNPNATISATDTTMPTDTTTPTSDSVPNDGDNVVIEPGTPLDNTELTQLIAGLSEQIEDLSDVVNKSIEQLDAAVARITAAESDLTDAQSDATSALSQAKKAMTAAESATTKVDEVAASVEQVSSAVSQVKTKLVKISDDGTYTGTITPAQLSRKLTAVDLSGDWPLDRTSGELDSAKLKAPTFGCWPDSRYNTVVTFDAWSRIACLRLPK
jgi:hypothetical protein